MEVISHAHKKVEATSQNAFDVDDTSFRLSVRHLKAIPASQFGDASRHGGKTNSKIVVNHETGGCNSECEIETSFSASSVDVLRGFSEARGPRYLELKLQRRKLCPRGGETIVEHAPSEQKLNSIESTSARYV